MIPVLITPINPVSGAPAVGIAAANISGNAPQVPAAVSALPPGTLLQGFVLNRDGSGNPTLRTELGDFLLQSNFFLKIGSNVVVRVDAMGQNFRANIIEVDGSPVSAEKPNNTPTQNAKPADDEIIRSSWIPQINNTSPTNSSTVLNAVLLSPNKEASAQQLKEGTALLVKLFNIQLPSTQAATPAPPSAPGAPPPAASNNVAAQAGTASTNNAPANNSTTSGNTELPVSATSASAYQSYASSKQADARSPTPTGASPNNAVSQNIPQQAMLLTVIGQERDGDPVLQTPFGLIKITSGATLATGTQIQASLSLANNDAELAATQSLDDTTTSISTLAQKWPTLTQILSLLTDAEDGTIPLQLAQMIPQIQTSNNQLQLNSNNAGVGFFMFLAALQNGDARSFLGERHIKQLEKLGQTSLINKLESEFQLLTKLSTDAPPQGWQSTFLPVLVNGQVEMTRWFTKRDQEKDKDGKKREDNITRFIVEVTMSQLGDLQLDGFFKQHEGTKQFELIVRSHQPLDADIQRDIQQIYLEAQSTTGVSGSLIFQASEQFPIQPLQDALGNPPDVFA